jgi:hypothetical protein
MTYTIVSVIVLSPVVDQVNNIDYMVKLYVIFWSDYRFIRLLGGSEVDVSTKSYQSNTVTHRIPNRPVFEWSLFGYFLCPVFEF